MSTVRGLPSLSASLCGVVVPTLPLHDTFSQSPAGGATFDGMIDRWGNRQMDDWTENYQPDRWSNNHSDRQTNGWIDENWLLQRRLLTLD